MLFQLAEIQQCLEYQVGRNLKHHLVQPYLEKHSLDKTAQHPVQLNPKIIQH